jgi:uncharacterized protein YjbI with pentapeptide repeats
MANPEHLAKLREGPEVWNQWRRKHSDVVPDLSEADLREADLHFGYLWDANLSGANLRGANLSFAILIEANLSKTNLTRANLSPATLYEANLSGANLGRANLNVANLVGARLSTADLGGADLREADLSRAQLWGADLHAAKLSGADLSGADLFGANLSEANLSGADCHETRFRETVFGATDLREVKGLDTCRHDGPSAIDHRTIAISGSLPLPFLRGCGLSDWQIEATRLNLKNLSNHEVNDIVYRIATLHCGQPIQFYSCFISYSTKDQEFAKRLYADLQEEGVRCWFAPDKLKIGDPFRQRIDEAIRRHQKLLVILSEHSVESNWVRDEVESCFEREHREKSIVLFPVRLDGAVMDTDAAWAASSRRQRHMGDFSKWRDHDSYQKAFDRLLKDLKADAESADTATGRAD